MSLCLTPKAGMIFVRPVEPQPTTSPNGLIQVADAYDGGVATTGEIVALAKAFCCSECGGERDTELHEGDVVIWPPSAGNEFAWGDETLLAIREADVLGIVWSQEGSLAV